MNIAYRHVMTIHPGQMREPLGNTQVALDDDGTRSIYNMDDIVNGGLEKCAASKFRAWAKSTLKPGQQITGAWPVYTLIRS